MPPMPGGGMGMPGGQRAFPMLGGMQGAGSPNAPQQFPGSAAPWMRGLGPQFPGGMPGQPGALQPGQYPFNLSKVLGGRNLPSSFGQPGMAQSTNPYQDNYRA